MRTRIKALAAGIALTAILSCSAMGLCWRQVIRMAHDCCAGEESAGPAKPCASPVAHEMTVKLVPPAVAVLPVALAWSPFPGLFQPVVDSNLRAAPPPLVLRI